MSEILYNHEEDDWTWASESLEEAAEHYLEGLDLEELKACDKITLYRGKKQSQTFADYFSVDDIIENMRERAYDEADDLAEKFLDDVTQEMEDELEKLVVGWADKYDLDPNFFLVGDIQEVEYTVPRETIEEHIKTIERVNNI